MQKKVIPEISLYVPFPRSVKLEVIGGVPAKEFADVVKEFDVG